MILVGHAQSRQPPSILEVGVERKAVCFHRQRRAGRMNHHGASEIVAKGGFELLAPARRFRREAFESKKDRRAIKSRVQTATAVEADFLRVEFVEVMQDAADGEALVIIQGMVEEASGDSVAIEHQILANEAGGVGETVGKLLVGGKQEQTRGFRAVRANDDGLGSLQMSVPLPIEIESPGGAAITVQLDAMDIGIRANFTAAGAFGHTDYGSERAGLRADFAAEAPTKAAIDTSAAAGAQLRKDGHRRRERIPAKFAGRALENDARRFHRKRRHGIRLRTWRIERAGPGEARYTNFPFHLRVIWLEVGVCNWPIGEAGPGNGADLAALDKIDFVEAPVIGGEVYAGAAHAAAVSDHPLLSRFLIGVFSESIGLEFAVIGE